MPVVDDIYLGNPNLKKANVQQQFTKEQILEQRWLSLNQDYQDRYHQVQA